MIRRLDPSYSDRFYFAISLSLRHCLPVVDFPAPFEPAIINKDGIRIYERRNDFRNDARSFAESTLITAKSC
jgi:hypothetical protein